MRQFFAGEKLQVGSRYYFDRNQSHHIADVLRMKNDDEVRIVDCDGRAFTGRLFFENGKVGATLTYENEGFEEPSVICVAALIKKEKWELVIQKACELGATRIVPLITRRTIIRLEEKEISRKLERWNKIALEACQQCNRTTVCTVERPVTISQLDQYKQEVNLVAYENEENVRLRDVLDSDRITFVVGPEGGFEKEEVSKLTDMGFVSVSLGNRILRAETATIFILSVIEGLR
jgi:16S rRNA (uracil1498-N3)-methyltransferase